MSTQLPANDSSRPEAPGEDLSVKARSLARVCRRGLKRLHRKRAKQEEELSEAGSWERYRHIADSLSAAGADIPRGASTFALTDVHTGVTEEVRLNPKLDVHRNAELYYKKARRGKRGLEIAEKNVDDTKEQIKALEQVAASLNPEETELTEETIRRAENVLIDMSILPRSGAGKTKPEERKPPYRHIAVEGWDIYIGKNDRQNDELSMHFAKPWDVWLHVAAHSGSHVVLKRPKGTDWPPRRIVEKAAGLAVWFSKARHTSYAEVHATERRFVRKRRKAPPGEVIAERCRTIRVAPISPRELNE